MPGSDAVEGAPEPAAGRAPSVSVVIPCYNAAASLPELLERLAPVLDDHTDAWEVVLVDDGSRDATWTVAAGLAAADARVRGVRLARNFGQHNALLAGVRTARHDVVVTMDDDLEHRPEDVPRVLAALAPDVDLVYAYPATENHSLLRNVASRFTKVAMSAAFGSDDDRAATLHYSAFRAFRTRMRESFAATNDPFVSLDVLLWWGTTRVTCIPVEMGRRAHGHSGYTFGRLVRHAVNTLTGYSTMPLRVVTTVGFTFAFFGLVVLGVVLGNYLLHGAAVPGFAFLASLTAILGGAQLFALGVLGEYLGRMHYRSMGRPPFVIRETCGPAPSVAAGPAT